MKQVKIIPEKESLPLNGKHRTQVHIPDYREWGWEW